MKKILVLAPHDLVLDPRIKWMCESLSSTFDVHAIGVKQETRAHNYDTSVKTHQLPNEPEIAVGLKALLTILSPIHIFSLLITAIILSPVLILFSILRYTEVILSKTLKTGSPLKEKLKGVSRKIFEIKVIYNLYSLIYLVRHFIRVLSLFVKYFDEKNFKDVNYVMANDLDSVLPAIYLKKKVGCEVIYDAHEFYPFQFPNSMWVLVKPLALIEKILLSDVKSMITVTPQLADVIRQYYRLDKKVFCIPNCAPIDPLFNKTSNSNEKIVFLFQGNFALGRGLETLISFWSQLNPEGAVLKLRGPRNAFKDYCEKIALDHGTLNKSIFFDEPVIEDHLIKAASMADVGVIPYEASTINNLNCCPNKLSQYMQSGIAVLSNDLPFIASILSKSEAGLTYRSDDFESFKNSLNKLINEPAYLADLKVKARKFAEQEYNWHTVSSSVFKEVFNS